MSGITDSQWFKRKEAQDPKRTQVITVRLPLALKVRLDNAVRGLGVSMNRACCGAVEAMVVELETREAREPGGTSA